MIARWFLLLSLTALCRAQNDRYNLMPLPAKISPASGSLVISPEFRVAVNGDADIVAKHAAERFIARLSKRTLQKFDANLSVNAEDTLTIHCSGTTRTAPSPEDDESYKLQITPKTARLDAPSPLGVLRGLETLLQLGEQNNGAWSFPSVTIQDRPRYSWRGLMIDVSRHFMTYETVLRQLDAMAAVKLNVFHWHLSDDQGFRVESKVFPRLHTVGSGGQYYTQDQVRRVVEYARERGIRIIPEFDMPGHASAILAAYPSLGSGPGPVKIAKTWNMLNAALDPTNEEVYAFIEKLLAEMGTLFPDKHIHIGGDEVNGRPWATNARIQAWMRKEGIRGKQALHAYFNRRVSTIVTKLGKTMVGWDEILHPDLPSATVVQSWRGASSLAKATDQGYSGVMSSGYYLDHMKSAAYHYSNDPGNGERILGGEACMWVEYVTNENIDMRIWPRMAAMAERFWSPENVRDIDSMYKRLSAVSDLLEEQGLQIRAAQKRMLKRLAGSHDPGPLEVLDAALEPVKMYARSTSRSYTTDTPMNRLVDATPPESEAARDLAKLVDQALAGNAEARRQVRQKLEHWRDNHKAVLPVLQSSSLLTEIVPLAEYVRDLSAAGAEALGLIEKGIAPSPEWIAKQSALLDTEGKRTPGLANQHHCTALMAQYSRRRTRTRRQCAEPRYVEELVPVIVEPIGKLVQAASRGRATD